MKKLMTIITLILSSFIPLYGSVTSFLECSIDLQEEINSISSTAFKDTTIKICGTHVGIFYVPAPTFPITIFLVGEDDEAALEGHGIGSVLTVSPFARVELKKLTIKNGITFTNGAGISNEGIMVIDRCRITGNYAGGNGGGIYNGGDVIGKGILNIYNSKIDNNSVGELGGGIFNFGEAIVMIKDSIIEENSAYLDGGGIYNLSSDSFVIDDSEVKHNTPNQIAP